MKTNKLIFLFSILFSMLATNASAYDFAVKNADGVMFYYNYTNKNTEAEVTYKTQFYDDYSGAVVIPNEVTYNNKTLKVTSIGNNAFDDCTKLTSITIPNSVTSIGRCAFYACSNLTSITIPNNVTSIGEQIFAGCYGLTSIIVEKKNPKYDSRNDCNAIIETNSNTLIAGCKSTVIPNGVNNIGEYAFYYSNLSSITIPNSVTSIGNAAFATCGSLNSITIPNSVKSIGNAAFSNCESLKDITIPNSVTSINDNTFRYCSKLTSVTIPNSVKSIGNGAFDGCRSLNSITIPNSVKSIGNAAFSNCESLKDITIPNSVTSIGRCAFSDCSNLTSITIPNSVTSIGEQIFAYCYGLTSIIVEKKNPKYDSRNDCNAIIETNSNTLIAGCKSTVIPNGVNNIGEYAFYYSNLSSITIPNSVTSIGEKAFYCNYLLSVTSKITKPFAINDNTFRNYDATLYVPKGTVAKYKATQGWKNFKNIVEEGTTTGIDDVEADNTLDTSKGIYDINGKRLSATSLDELPSGLYIINGKKVVR